MPSEEIRQVRLFTGAATTIDGREENSSHRGRETAARGGNLLPALLLCVFIVRRMETIRGQEQHPDRSCERRC